MVDKRKANLEDGGGLDEVLSSRVHVKQVRRFGASFCARLSRQKIKKLLNDMTDDSLSRMKDPTDQEVVMI